MATTPGPHDAFAGTLSRVEWPGPPPPVTVGSPPWITKPGTMRWKIVSSKKPLRASATNEAAAFGDVFGSSRIVNAPQLVWSVTSYFFELSSGFDGLFCPPPARGVGWSTSLQTPSVCAVSAGAVLVSVFDDEELPLSS